MSRLAALLGLSLIAALAAAPPAASASPTPGAALTALNKWRAQAGLDPVEALDPELSEGCRLHNAYLARNNVPFSLNWHEEDPAKPGYTQLGDEAAGTSVLSSGEGGPRVWEDAVYHRMSLLHPRLRTTWFSASSGFTCMGTSDESAPPAPAFGLFPWPANGAVGVPTSFACCELPDPYDAVPKSVKTLGYLISVGVDGPWEGSAGVGISSASLTPDGGSPVAITVLDDDMSDESKATAGADFFAIFPHKPLLSYTWYTAHAVGSVDACSPTPSAPNGELCGSVRDFDFTWRFRTQGAKTSPTRIVIGGGGRIGTVRRLSLRVVTPSAAVVRVTIRRHGTLVKKRALRNGARWSPKLRAGRYRVCGSQKASGPYPAYSRCVTVRVGRGGR